MEKYLDIKIYQNRLNKKTQSNYNFEGNIKYSKIGTGYVIWINLIVFNIDTIEYDYSREFVINKKQFTTENFNKNLFMDKFELIDILEDILDENRIEINYNNCKI